MPLLRPTFRLVFLVIAGTCFQAGGQADEAAITDPELAVSDPDFLIQGEYVGDRNGMQVVAAGEGEFNIVVYEGGLPGAGANRLEPRRIEGDADVVADLIESMNLSRVERTSPTLGAKPPVGSVVLFDGTPQSVEANWEKGRLSDDGLLMPGTISKKSFDDYSLHIEFRTPWMPTKTGQARGNSGVYHQARYETQVLDSFGLAGRMNETGGIYSIRDPDLNMCFPPLRWQTYDIDFTAAVYDPSGKKVSPARITVRLNGVVVQNDIAVGKRTTAAPFPEADTPGPIYLQDHGNPVRFRNVWVLPRDADREARRPIVPGFERFYADSSTPSADGGDLLISNLACDACHPGSDAARLPVQRGPDLSEVAGRLRGDAVLAMIADPHGTKAGTTMPLVWHDLDQPQREQCAEAIASYLLRSGGGMLKDRVVSQATANQGRKLYHRVGCVACHRSFDGNDTPAATTVPLGQLANKYTAASLAKFLRQPHAIRKGLRMPALQGSATDAFAIAAFLTQDVTVRKSDARFRRRIYRGKWSELPDFESLNPIQSDEVVGLKINDIKPENDFGVVFEAELPIHKKGTYTFKLSSDDGSAMEIAGNRLENDGVHAMQAREASFDLAAGTHLLRIELFNAGGGVELSLQMQDPDFGATDIADLILDPENPPPEDLLPSKFQPKNSLVEQGKQWFATSGCANCHAMGETRQPTPPGPPLDQLRVDHGCLASNVKSPAVDYELNLRRERRLPRQLNVGEMVRPRSTMPGAFIERWQH